MTTYLQLERIERSLHLNLDEIDDSVHVLVRCMLDHVVEAVLKKKSSPRPAFRVMT